MVGSGTLGGRAGIGGNLGICFWSTTLNFFPAFAPLSAPELSSASVAPAAPVALVAPAAPEALVAPGVFATAPGVPVAPGLLVAPAALVG